MLFNSHQFFKTCKTVHNDSCESLDFVLFDGFLQGLKAGQDCNNTISYFQEFPEFLTSWMVQLVVFSGDYRQCILLLLQPIFPFLYQTVSMFSLIFSIE